MVHTKEVYTTLVGEADRAIVALAGITLVVTCFMKIGSKDWRNANGAEVLSLMNWFLMAWQGDIRTDEDKILRRVVKIL